MSKEDITLNYDFDARQTDYYTNAGKYLGLIENIGVDGQVGCRLTRLGLHLFGLPIVDRQIEFADLILSHGAFKKTMKKYLENGQLPSRNDVVEILKTSKLYNIESEETYRRRASTVISWINWIMGLIEE
jgi:hypothetical protein